MRELEKNLQNNSIYQAKTFLPFIKKISFLGETKKNGYFLNVNANSNIIISGWKIHLSPLLTDYFNVLRAVNKICWNRKINYKFIDTLEGYRLFTGKNIPPSQFGKIITIYPNNKKEFNDLLNIFYNLFHSIKGIMVPSDHIFKNSSIINYRYGGINPIIKITEANDIESFIFNGNGELVKDERKPYFILPEGIKLPLEYDNKEISKKLIFKGKGNNKIIEIKRIIRRIATGNIYLGIVDGKEVIIKEAKYGALNSKQSLQGAACLLKKNEKKVLKKIHINNLPKYIDEFEINNDYFIVESKIDGINLRKFSSELSLMKPGNSIDHIQDIKRIKRVFNNLKKLGDAIHRSGYIIGDVSPDNFVVNSNDEVFLIDCETVHPVTEKKSFLNLETEMFIKNIKSDVSGYEKDNYKLGMSMFWILTQKNKEIQNNFEMIKYYLNLLSKKYSLLSNVNAMIINLIESKIKTKVTEKKSLTEIKNIVKKQLINKSQIQNEFLTTQYVKSDLSFINGISGIIFYLNYKKILNVTDKQKWSQFILKRYSKDLTGSGLFFGKMGIALTLSRLGVSFEQNKPLLDLLYKLNSLQQIHLSIPADLANGTAGLLIGFNLLVKTSDYPSFSYIRKRLIHSLIKYHETDENGIEYGKLGILNCVYFLNKRDNLFKKIYKQEFFDDLKYEVEKLIRRNIQNKTFLGIPEYQDKNIIYPNLMTGGAGAILYCLFCNDLGISQSTLLKQYDVPFMVNNGISYGIAGFILPLLLGLKYNKFHDIKIVKKILKRWEKYIQENFIENDGYWGWSSDQGLNIHDDIGSGNVGILMMLDIMSEVMNDEGKRSTN